MLALDYLELAGMLGIVGRRTAGSELSARCPLHHERNPSFSLNLDTGLWFCHAGCGGGNFEQLAMQLLDQGYRETVRWMYNSTSVLILKTVEPPEIVEEDHLEQDMAHYDALPERRMAKYWVQRGYPISHAYRWGVRYSMLTQELWIPYRWPFNGPIIGFTKRTTVPDKRPKYQHTPGMPRNEYLFGHGAIPEMGKPLLITEGPFDVMRADLHGYPAVAILGTYMSNKQAQQLFGNQRETILAFDSGTEGRRATEAASTLLEKYGIISRVIRFPASEGELDLDSLSAAQLQQGIDQSRLKFLA